LLCKVRSLSRRHAHPQTAARGDAAASLMRARSAAHDRLERGNALQTLIVAPASPPLVGPAVPAAGAQLSASALRHRRRLFLPGALPARSSVSGRWEFLPCKGCRNARMPRRAGRPAAYCCNSNRQSRQMRAAFALRACAAFCSIEKKLCPPGDHLFERRYNGFASARSVAAYECDARACRAHTTLRGDGLASRRRPSLRGGVTILPCGSGSCGPARLGQRDDPAESLEAGRIGATKALDRLIGIADGAKFFDPVGAATWSGGIGCASRSVEFRRHLDPPSGCESAQARIACCAPTRDRKRDEIVEINPIGARRCACVGRRQVARAHAVQLRFFREIVAEPLRPRAAVTNRAARD